MLKECARKLLRRYKMQKMDKELSLAEKYADLIIDKREELKNLLCTTETYATAEDEIYRSIKYLCSFSNKQKAYISSEKSQIVCCYLPLNQPLYSFVLNVLTVSFACKKVYYRPPQKLWGLHQSIYELLVKEQSSIQIVMVSRNKFLKEYVDFAEIVIYTGRYENVQELCNCINKETLLIYNGSALNPVIVTENADLDVCCEEIINARLYNTGQDCMAPAAILIHDDIADKFMRNLIDRLDAVRLGENSWNPVIIGSMISKDSFSENIKYILSNADSIVYGGHWDENNFLISPTIFLNKRYSGENQPIFYAPFFCIYQYACLQEIRMYFSTKEAECYKGYVSIFGSDSDVKSLNLGEHGLIVLKNQTLFRYEDGNAEFGGYGEGCSFVMHNGKKEIHPILLLREISEWRNKR